MSTIQRMVISLPDDTAVVVKDAVDAGDHASTGDIVQEALRDWTSKRAVQRHQLASAKADLDKGLADLAAGRVTAFDARGSSPWGRHSWRQARKPSSPFRLGVTVAVWLERKQGPSI